MHLLFETLTCRIEAAIDTDREETIEYNNVDKEVTWKIAKLGGGRETSSKIKLSLDTESPGDHRRELGPIRYVTSQSLFLTFSALNSN